VTRTTRPLSTTAIEERRQQLADRFGCEVPRQSFFQDILASDASTGAAVVLARSQQYKEEVQCKFEQLQANGSEFTVWPIDGRWRLPPIDAQVLARHSAMTARLAARYHSLSPLALALQRRTTQHLAQHLLRRCYRQAPAQWRPSRPLARHTLDMCYRRQVPEEVSTDATVSEECDLRCKHQHIPGCGSCVDVAKMSTSTLSVHSALGKCNDIAEVDHCNASF